MSDRINGVFLIKDFFMGGNIDNKWGIRQRRSEEPGLSTDRVEIEKNVVDPRFWPETIEVRGQVYEVIALRGTKEESAFKENLHPKSSHSYIRHWGVAPIFVVRDEFGFEYIAKLFLGRDPDVLKEAATATQLIGSRRVAPIIVDEYVGFGSWYLSPFYRGFALEEIMTNGVLLDEPLFPEFVRKVMLQMAEVLEECTEVEFQDDGEVRSGVVLRDVKPDNVLSTGSFDEPEIVLIDNDLAMRSTFRDEAGIIRGSTPFMSPEFVSGHMLLKGDVFAAGASIPWLFGRHHYITVFGEPGPSQFDRLMDRVHLRDDVVDLGLIEFHKMLNAKYPDTRTTNECLVEATRGALRKSTDDRFDAVELKNALIM